MAIMSLTPASNTQQVQVKSTQLPYITPFGGKFANADTAWTVTTTTFTAGKLSMRANGAGAGKFDTVYPPALAGHLHRIAELPASNPNDSLYVFQNMPSSQLWSLDFALSLAGGSASTKTGVARIWAMRQVPTGNNTVERIGKYIGELALTAGALPVTLSENGVKSSLYPAGITGDFYWVDNIITDDYTLSNNMRVIGNKAGCIASVVFDAIGLSDLIVAIGQGPATPADAGFVLPAGI
jgi:hypothetical protein